MRLLQLHFSLSLTDSVPAPDLLVTFRNRSLSIGTVGGRDSRTCLHAILMVCAWVVLLFGLQRFSTLDS